MKNDDDAKFPNSMKERERERETEKTIIIITKTGRVLKGEHTST